MAKLKVGNVVVLKSGGPAMTVAHVSVEGGAITCTWFDHTFTKPHVIEIAAGAVQLVPAAPLEKVLVEPEAAK